MFIVTGANGFIGSALVWDLNRKGITDIVCVDTVSLEERGQLLQPLKYKEFHEAYAYLEMLESLEQTNIQGIFHMGACSSTTESNWDYLKKNNLEFTQRLFKFCTKFDIPFIYASSGAVYGDGANGFSDKTPSTTFKPLNLYGKSKLDFDIWALQQKTTPSKWQGLRFFNVYGPNEYYKNEMSSVVFKAFHQIKDTSELKLFKSHNSEYADGKQMRDFVYVKDITRWMIELLENKKIKNGIFNLGFGKARTWLDLAHAVFENLSQPVNIDWIDIPLHIREQYQYFTEARIDKLEEQGLSAPQWPLEKGVQDYLKNYLLKNDPHLN